MLEGIKHVHFVGIGGAGMSGIAHVLCEMGYTVSGSDLNMSVAAQRLKDSGAQIYIGHARNQMGDPDIVVISTAIPPSNVELLEAQERGILIWPRAKMLGAIMSQQKGIAIAGAHGKTTTTSMVALILEKCGQDPSVIVGGELNDIGGNAKLGAGEYLVAEADESDGSFLFLDPKILVVTNIENDHLDYYGSMERILETFHIMMDKVPENGLAVLCADDDNMAAVSEGLRARIVTYGMYGNADYQVRNVAWQPLGSSYDVIYQGQLLGSVDLHVPGLHNIKNALAAIAVCRHIGLDFSDIAHALSHFRGVHRRFQLMGSVDDIRVFDDYAHHPSELKATLGAAKLEHPNRVVAIFQPHRYTRTHSLQKDFGSAFVDADVVILTEIYAAGEKPIEGINGEVLYREVIANGHRHVQYIADLNAIPAILADVLQPGDLVLTLGAGNVWQAGPALLAVLKTKR